MTNTILPQDAHVLFAVTDRQGYEVGDIVRDRDGSVWLQKRGINPRTAKVLKPGGWAIERAHLNILMEYAGAGVRLSLIGGKGVAAPTEAFSLRGIPINRGSYGPQVVALDSHWRSTCAEAVVHGRELRSPPAPSSSSHQTMLSFAPAMQARLFEVA